MNYTVRDKQEFKYNPILRFPHISCAHEFKGFTPYPGKQIHAQHNNGKSRKWREKC